MKSKPTFFFYSLVTIVVIGAFAQWQLRRLGSESGSVDETVLSDLRTFRPSIVGTSPTGSLYLLRSYSPTEGAEQLAVYDTFTKNLVATHAPLGPPLRLAWRPDSGALAYFIQSTQGISRRLYIWDLKRNHQFEVSIPQSHAQSIVKWSPDGSLIAFSSRPNGLIIVNPTDPEARPIVIEDKIVAFDWSTDSSSIAVLKSSGSESPAIFILDPTNGNVTERKNIEDLGVIQEICWQGSNEILVLSHLMSNGGVEYRLTDVDSLTGTPRPLLQSKENIRDIIKSRKGSRILWHRQKNEIDNQLVVWDRISEPHALNASGDWHFRSLPEVEREAVDCLSYTPAIHTLERMDLGGEHIAQIAIQSGFSNNVVHKRVLLNTKDAKQVPILVSQVKSDADNCVVIRMGGGESLNLGGERWTEKQLYAKRNVDFINVPNRPGNGASDLLEACDFAVNQLHVSRKNIVLLGASTGAQIVLEAVIRDPECAGTVALVGLVAPPSVAKRLLGPRPRVLWFHGEHDPGVSPTASMNIVRSIMPNALRGDVFTVLKNEGHSPADDHSKAQVHSAILKALRK